MRDEVTMDKVGCRLLAGGVLLAGLLGAAPAAAMPLDLAPATDGLVTPAQFLGGPFFGRYGYNQPDPAKRFYFYPGFDPSLYPPKAGGTRRVTRRRYHRRVVVEKY